MKIFITITMWLICVAMCVAIFILGEGRGLEMLVEVAFFAIGLYLFVEMLEYSDKHGFDR